MRHYRKELCLGLSLLELLVTLTLASIVSGLAMTYMPDWADRRKSDAVINTLRTAINTARHAAIAKNANVVVCPRAQTGRGEECGPRNTWHHGILIFEDLDRDRRPSEGDVPIARLPQIDSGRIYWRAFRNRSYLLFTARGLTDWQNGHLLYCPNDGDMRYARQLVLNYAGRTYASKDADGDGVHEDAHGETLVCS